MNEATIQTLPTNNVSNNKKALVSSKNLTNKAILLSVNVGGYTGVVKDKQLGAEMAALKNAKSDRINGSKNLIVSKELDAVRSAAGKIRIIFYDNTAEWGTNNERICRSINYIKVKQAIEEAIREYDEKVTAFLNVYDDLVEESKADLGDSFNASDFKSRAFLENRFKARVLVKPVPTSDFRSGVMDDDDINYINKQIEDYTQEAVKNAQKDNLSRVQDKLNKLIERLMLTGSKGTRLHSSAVDNVVKAVEDARSLNISDDAEVDALLDDVETNIKKIDVDLVKNHNVFREASIDTAKEAASSITKTMESFDF